MRKALKWQYLVVVGAKPFPANQNVKYECFHWASKYSKLLACSVIETGMVVLKSVFLIKQNIVYIGQMDRVLHKIDIAFQQAVCNMKL